MNLTDEQYYYYCKLNYKNGYRQAISDLMHRLNVSQNVGQSISIEAIVYVLSEMNTYDNISDSFDRS